MLTYWEILTEIQSNAPVSDIYAQLWGKKLSNAYTVLTYTGTLPATLAGTEAGYLESYTIYGNTENDESVGERTENLYNKNDPDIVYSAYMNIYGTIMTGGYGDSVKVSGYIPINGGTTYIGTNLMNSGSGNYYSYYDANKQRVGGGSVSNNMVFDSPINAAYIRTTIINRNIEDIAMLIEGSTAPTSYIPYGYKLPMKISHKVALTSDDLLRGVWLVSTGQFTDQYPYYICTQKIPVESGTVDVYVKTSKMTSELDVNFYNGKTYLGHKTVKGYGDYEAQISVEVPMNATECAITVGWFGGVNLYPSDAEVFDINWIMATPNIYIGSDPLAEDEYVDFEEQKVYHMESGTLTPTDPPVPIPALPTIDGETIIDWAGSGLAPSEVELICKTKR